MPGWQVLVNDSTAVMYDYGIALNWTPLCFNLYEYQQFLDCDWIDDRLCTRKLCSRRRRTLYDRPELETI